MCRRRSRCLQQGYWLRVLLGTRAAACHCNVSKPYEILPCLGAEMLVDLPLAYFLPPNATDPGQLPMTLDLEQTRWVLWNVRLMGRGLLLCRTAAALPPTCRHSPEPQPFQTLPTLTAPTPSLPSSPPQHGGGRRPLQPGAAQPLPVGGRALQCSGTGPAGQPHLCAECQ